MITTMENTETKMPDDDKGNAMDKDIKRALRASVLTALITLAAFAYGIIVWALATYAPRGILTAFWVTLLVGLVLWLWVMIYQETKEDEL